jgi:hypothetical protein
MKYIKPLIDKNLEQFRQNIESSLYAKLSEKLDEVKVDVASDIYNEGRCVPCSQKMNEETQDCDELYEDCMEEVKAAGGDAETHGGETRCMDKKRKCEEKQKLKESNHEDGDACAEKCEDKVEARYGNKQTINGVDRRDAVENCLNDCYKKHSY